MPCVTVSGAFAPQSECGFIIMEVQMPKSTTLVVFSLVSVGFIQNAIGSILVL
jgi:hypothetical protein